MLCARAEPRRVVRRAQAERVGTSMVDEKDLVEPSGRSCPKGDGGTGKRALWMMCFCCCGI